MAAAMTFLNLDLKDKWSVMKNVFKVNHTKDLALARMRVFAHELQAKRWDYICGSRTQWADCASWNEATCKSSCILRKMMFVNNTQCSGDFETIYGCHSLRDMRLKASLSVQALALCTPNPYY
jgi:hypothetical protein